MATDKLVDFDHVKDYISREAAIEPKAVLVLDEMPKTCCECDLKIYDPEKRWDENGIEQIGAWVCKKTREIIWNTQRCESCPLVPLPAEHGRLIDADALYEVAKTRSMGIYGPCDFQCVITGNDILKAHTIVPIGGGEDG